MSTLGASAESYDPSDSSDESLSSGTSTKASQANEMDTTQKDQVKEVEEMAKRETKNMRVWKIVVSLTVLVTAILVSAGTYIFLQGDEDSSFEVSYQSFANTIGDAAEVHRDNLFTTVRSFSNTINAAAIATNSEFPFVTVPAFEVSAAAARQQSGLELLIFVPKVEVSEVTRWNEHANANGGWYEESKQLAVASGESTDVLSDFAPGGLLPFIYEPIVDENGMRSIAPATKNPPFYTSWQCSPPFYSPFFIKVNIGAGQEFADSFETGSVNKEGLLGRVLFSDEFGFAGLASKVEDHEAFHDQFKVTSETAKSSYDRPHSFFYQPIFREIYNDTSEVVGYILAVVPWDRYFANLLPDGVKGITCVASNTCGQSFTYFLNGNSVSCALSNALYCSWGDKRNKLTN
jgi:hypothetical protein